MIECSSCGMYLKLEEVEDPYYGTPLRIAECECGHIETREAN